MARKPNETNNLRKNKKYIDFGPIVKQKDYDILLCATKKGTGKTFGSIREGYINYIKTGHPFAYVRSTFEQQKEFMAEDKYVKLLNELGWYMASNESLSSKGHFKLKGVTKTRSKKVQTPIMYALSANSAMNIQSSKFEKISLMIIDEIQHHFRDQKIDVVNKIINLIASVMRDHNAPIWFIFNKIKEDDILLRLFNAEKEINKLKPGQFKKIICNLKTGQKIWDEKAKKFIPEILKLRVLLHSPKESSTFQKDLRNSVGYKLSALTEYGKVVNSDEFAQARKNINYIRELGKFKNIININGFEYGIWLKKKGDKEIYQFSRKYNKNGKSYYFSYIDYDMKSLQGSLEFIANLKHKLIRKELEFEDVDVFLSIIDLFKITNKK